jgi:putative membrane protein
MGRAENGNDGSPDKKTEWAEDRTDWAEDRTVLANERTFAAWARTAMASTALGLGFHAVVQKLEPTWIAKAGATLFILIAIGILGVAQANAAEVGKRLDTHGVDGLRRSRYRLIAGALVCACLVVMAIIWMLKG